MRVEDRNLDSRWSRDQAVKKEPHADDTFRIRHDDVAYSGLLRAAVVAFLTSHAADDADLMGAELIFGELLGNVVAHAPGPIEVSITWIRGQALLAIWDTGPSYTFDASLPEDILNERHRGLYIIDYLGEDLRVLRQGERNLTSVRLPVKRIL
jgi:anti-sigma regulatory factor (Ser/Thr protein kinase)